METLKHKLLGYLIEVDETAGKAVILTGANLTPNSALLPAKIQKVLTLHGATAKSDIPCSSLTCLMLTLTGKKGNAHLWLSADFIPVNQATATTTQNPAPTTTAQTPENGQPTTATENAGNTKQEEAGKPAETDEEKAKRELAEKALLIRDIKAFFVDFDHDPDTRELDTMLYQKEAGNYVHSFMKLCGIDEATLDIAENKFKSREWKEIEKRLKAIKPARSKPINSRLIVYFGKAGGGKTTLAMKQYPTAKKIVGSASFDPDDLFSRFDPATKAYVLTEIGQAMQNGEAIIFDEANLCSPAVLARLQSALDESPFVTDERMGNIQIKDGFKVIITMNLTTNLMGKTPLPNPLVSRAMELKDFDLIANQDEITAGYIW